MSIDYNEFWTKEAWEKKRKEWKPWKPYTKNP